jgi:hypothetical protein
MPAGKDGGPKLRRFFFHYNKPLSRQKGRPQISLHIGGRCWIVDNVTCRVPTAGRVNKRQPYFVMAGSCRAVKIRRRVAIVS